MRNFVFNYGKYIFVCLIILFGFSKGIQDKLNFKSYENSPANTWLNKYALNEAGNPLEYNGESWWYLGIYKPAYREKFFMSSTLFVAFTDKWHFWGLVRFFSFAISLIFFYGYMELTQSRFRKLWQWNLFVVLSVFLFRSVGFHLAYSLNLF